MNYDPQTISNIKLAEDGLLSSFMMTPDTFSVVGDWFEQGDFYDPKNGEVFRAIKKLYDSGAAVDIVSIAQEVKTTELKVHAANILGALGSSSNYEYYAKLVKEYSTKRKLEDVGKNLAYQSLGETNSGELIDGLEKSIASLTSTVRGNDEVNTEAKIDEIIANIRHLKENPQDVTGISTGFSDLDMKTSGLHKTDLIVLAARPGIGKSALAMQISRNVAMKNHPVMFFSLEMGAEQLLGRLIASESKVNTNGIKSGRISDVELEAIEIGGKIIKSMPLYINDRAGIQVKDIRSQLKQHNSRKQKIEVIVVDYIQLMVGSGKKDDTVRQVTEITRGLKMIAKDFGVTVIALSQFSRDVEKRGGKPRLSDLRDSGSIEQDADIVFFLHTETTEEDSFGNRDVELIIGKHRNGSNGSLSLKFQGSKMTFCEVDKSLDPANW